MAQGLELFVTGRTNSGKGSEMETQENDMTFCGHNPAMAGGIGTFVGGLTIQTLKRADAEKVSVAEIPALEIEEIDALLAEINASSKKAELAGVMAVGQLIRFFYATLDAKLAEDPAKTVESIFSATVAELNRLLFAMEDNYYEVLRPSNDRLTAIRLIRGFLETQV